MSGRYTNHLKLIKPSSGDKNWGTAINSNLDKLDAEFIGLNSWQNEIESKIGGDNYIFIDDEKSVMKIVDDGFFIGSLNELELLKAQEWPTDDNSLSEYNTIIYYPVDVESDQTLILSEIQDFQGFYIYDNYTPNGTANTIDSFESAGYHNTPQQLQWYMGDIIVKNSELYDTGKVPSYEKFPQSVGLILVPSVDSRDTSKIVFTRALPDTTQSNYILDYPLKYSTAMGITKVELKTVGTWVDNVWSYDTQVSIESGLADSMQFAPMHVTFYYRDTDNNSEQIWVDYSWFIKDGNWSIKVTLDQECMDTKDQIYLVFQCVKEENNA